MEKQRKYQAGWYMLKTNKELLILAERCFHKRIVKAISKEKYRDEGYKLQLLEDHRLARIEIKIEANYIRFKLKFSIAGVRV